MSRRAVWTALLVTLAAIVPPPHTAKAVAPEPWEGRARRLIAHLGDPDYQARVAAEQALRDLGPRVLPLLRGHALKHADLHVRRTARQLVPYLERVELLAPRRFTLRVKDRPLAAVLAELNRQSGQQVRLEDNCRHDPAKRYTLDLADVTFWEAVEQVCRASRLVVTPGGFAPIVRLGERRGEYWRFVSHDGAFRVAADGLHVEPAEPPKAAGPGRPESLALTILLSPEPHFRVLRVDKPRLDVVEDNNRQSLIPVPDHLPPRTHGPGNQGVGIHNMTWHLHTLLGVPLRRPSPGATHLRLIRGTLPVLVRARERSVVVTNRLAEAKGKTFKAADVEICFDEVVMDGYNNIYTFRLRRPGGFDLTDVSWSERYLTRRIEVQDAAGVSYAMFGGGIKVQASGEVEVRLRFIANRPAGKIGPATRFIYHDWVVRQHDIAFELRDLPLP